MACAPEPDARHRRPRDPLVGTAAAVGAKPATNCPGWRYLSPLLAVVLTIAAHVGAVARNDLQTLTVKPYGRRVGAILLVSVVVVNVVTIAADLQAGAAGIGLFAGVVSRWLVVPLGLALVGLLLVGKYDEVVAVLRYLLVGFLAFGAAVVLAHPDWSRLQAWSRCCRFVRGPRVPSRCSEPRLRATSTCGRPSAEGWRSHLTSAQVSKVLGGRGSALSPVLYSPR